MKVSVIIAHVDAVPDLDLTIKSHVEALKDIEYEIVVCDNGSDPADLKAMKKILAERTDTTLVFEKIKGTVAPFQKAAAAAKGEYLCISDQHIRVPEDFYRKQLAILDASPEIGTLYAKAILSLEDPPIEGNFCFHYNWGYAGNWRSSYAMVGLDSKPYPILVSQMGAPIIRRKLFNKFGGFSKTCFNKYGGYTAEELILGLKTWMWNYKTYMNPDTYYRHGSVRTEGHERGVVKRQPEALTIAGYLLGGDKRLEQLSIAWEVKLLEIEDYKDREAAVADIKQMTDRDHKWVLKNQVHSLEDIIRKFEKGKLK